jgi:DNA polymerase zeta
VTPNSMLRNMFARNRPSHSPYTSPSKPPTYPTTNTVVLTPSKRSVKGWQSPSPEPEDASEGSPTPTKIKGSMTHTFDEVKQELKEIQASDEPLDVQGGQNVRSSKSSGESDEKPVANGVKREISPTLRNDDPFQATYVDGTAVGQDETPRPTKRVRMASPKAPSQIVSSQSLLPTPQRLTLSQLSAKSHVTEDSTSTVPSNLSSTAWTYRTAPPSRQQIANTMEEFGVDSVIYTDPHYSNRSDIPGRAKMFAGRMFTLRGNGIKEMQEFESSFGGLKGKGRAGRGKKVGHHGWEYGPLPPRRQAVVSWCAEQDAEAERCEPYINRYIQSSLPVSSARRVCDFSARPTDSEEQVRIQVFAKEEIEGNGT